MRTIHAPQPARRGGTRPRTPTARRDLAGERVVHAALSSALDDRYVLVHGLHLPGGTGQIDAVLIGARILAMEIVSHTDPRLLRVRGARWEHQLEPGRWAPLDRQPGARAEAAARGVTYALHSAGLPAYGVLPIVVLLGGAEIVAERPRVAVMRPAEVARFAGEGPEPPQPAWPDLALRALLVAASAGVEAE